MPNYDLSNKPDIEIRLSYNEQIVIIGRLDNNFICWLSVTNITDEDINSQIFNDIAYDKSTKIIASIYNKVLEDKLYKSRYYYKATIKQGKNDD